MTEDIKGTCYKFAGLSAHRSKKSGVFDLRAVFCNVAQDPEELRIPNARDIANAFSTNPNPDFIPPPKITTLNANDIIKAVVCRSDPEYVRDIFEEQQAREILLDLGSENMTRVVNIMCRATLSDFSDYETMVPVTRLNLAL